MNIDSVVLWAGAIIAAALATLGCVTLFVGRRRRAGTIRRCAACEYPVHRLGPATSRCPECGNDLSAAGAVAVGRRGREPLLLVAGLALCVPMAGVVALVSVHFARKQTAAVVPPPVPPVIFAASPFAGVGRGSPPTPPPKPPSYEHLDDRALAEAILTEPPPADVAAMLAVAAERAGPSNDRVWPDAAPKREWVDRLLAVAVAKQVDEARPYDEPWAWFAEHVLPLRSLDQWRAYLRQGLRFEVTTRRATHIGGQFPLSVKIHSRLSEKLSRKIRVRLLSLTLGPLTTDELLLTPERSVYEFLNDQMMPNEGGRILQFLRFDPAAAAVAPGEHPVTLSIQVTTASTSTDWIERIERPATVLPPRPTGPAATSQPTVDAALSRSVRIEAAGEGLSWDGKRIRLHLACVDSPADVHARVYVMFRGTEYQLGYATWLRGQTVKRSFDWAYSDLGAAVGTPLMIKLKADPLHGDQTFHEVEWWPGQIALGPFTVGDATTRPVAPKR